MPRLATAILFAPLLLGFALTAAGADTAAGQLVTPDGFGPVKIGMGKDELMQTLGAGWIYQSDQSGEGGKPDSCAIVSNQKAFLDSKYTVSYMVEDGKVSRISVGRDAPADIHSEKGIHIGSSEDDVRQAYGSAVTAMPHQYDEAPAMYLTVWTIGAPATPDGDVSDPNARGIRFVTDHNKKVVEILGGGAAIQYVEGCA